MFKRIAKLYERATGGSNIAADPNHPLDSFWPSSKDAVGIEIAEGWFRKRIDEKSQTLLFLVGGPGGGKSHVAARLVTGLTELDPTDGELARRSHLYKLADNELLLINDATIEESGEDENGLRFEIEESLQSGRSIIACVNRGILVEELAHEVQGRSLTMALMHWLDGSEVPSDDQTIETLESSDYLKLGRVQTSSGVSFEICVVFVDACSLFEKAPHTHFSSKLNNTYSLEMDEYRLTSLGKRSKLELSDLAGAQLISGAIAALVSDGSEGFPEDIVCNPLSSNLKNLSNEKIVRSLSTVMRSGEIATGHRFTYREVWGAIARCVLGDLSRTNASSELELALRQMQPKSGNPAARFRDFQRLGDLRFHQSIFGTMDDSLVGSPHPTNPVLRIMSAVDPIRDSQPGYFDSRDDSSGWVTPLLDAFTGSLAAGSPLHSIMNQLSESKEDLFPDSVTSFEWQIDTAFTELMADSSVKAKDRQRAIRWYSTYLSRLYAVSNGVSAFREQVATWIQIWSTAPSLPIDIEKKFMTMLRPRRPDSSDESSYIPLFDSQTVTITNETNFPRLSARLSDLKAVTRRSGDSIILTLKEQGASVSDILLDFALLRDALVCTSNELGVSDVSSATAPRLERMRAARLTPAMLETKAPISILFGKSTTEVVIGK